MAWPESYGGRGAGPVEHFIVQEELARARAPEMVGRIGLNLAAPTLLARGTEEQQERWLSRIRTAEELWCQLFSEPGAGSDLASLVTRADRVEGGWLVNGQKVWTSYAQFADWGVCLARTDPAAPKHKGISYLVIDMHHPGVEVRPLVQLTGEAEFNEVFLTDVFVPEDQLIGPEHEGWRVANSTLSHERGTNPRQLVIHMQLLEELLRLAEENGSFDDRRTARRAGPGLRGDPAVPAAQPAQREPAVPRARAGPRGQRPQAVLERDVQALPRDRHGRPGRRRSAVEGCRPTTRGTGGGSAPGSTTRRRRSGPAPTRSSATSSANVSSACPGRPRRPRGEPVTGTRSRSSERERDMMP